VISKRNQAPPQSLSDLGVLDNFKAEFKAELVEIREKIAELIAEPLPEPPTSLKAGDSISFKTLILAVGLNCVIFAIILWILR
jgi:hypothetical protein